MALAETANRETAAEGTTYSNGSNVDKLSGSPTDLVGLHLGLLENSDLFAAPVDTTTAGNSYSNSIPLLQRLVSTAARLAEASMQS